MISGPEIAVIAVIALLLFGPDKIPQMLKTLKKAAGLYAEAKDQVQEVVSTHVISPEELEMLKDPLGLSGSGANAGSKQALLSPERKSLYNQSLPKPELHTSSAVEPAATASTDVAVPADAKASAAATAPVDAAVTTSATANSSATNPVTVPAVPTPVVAVSPTPVPASTSAAGSIWASLEQSSSLQNMQGLQDLQDSQDKEEAH